MSQFNRSELLNMLLYGASMAMRPTMSNLFHGDRYWCDYAQRHRSQLTAMERAGLIESQGSRDDDWAIRLTESGQLKAIGGRHAPERWEREWDGQWSLLMFDLGAPAGSLRQKLFRWLRANQFGCLQQSVWINADPVEGAMQSLLEDFGDHADHILTLRHTINSGIHAQSTPAKIAAQTWDFDQINKRYQEYIDLAKHGLPKRPTPDGARRWIASEHRLWKAAFNPDPLLPEKALPKSYLGKQAWQHRSKLLENAAPLNVALTKNEEPAKAQA